MLKLLSFRNKLILANSLSGQTSLLHLNLLSPNGLYPFILIQNSLLWSIDFVEILNFLLVILIFIFPKLF